MVRTVTALSGIFNPTRAPYTVEPGGAAAEGRGPEELTVICVAVRTPVGPFSVVRVIALLAGIWSRREIIPFTRITALGATWIVRGLARVRIVIVELAVSIRFTQPPTAIC